MIKRILIVASCVALLVCVLVLPASAAPLDYNDYITNVTVDGDNDIVTVHFPLSSSLVTLFDVSAGTSSEIYGNSGSFPIISGNRYALELTFFYPDLILLSNIPSNTVVIIDADISFTHSYFDVTTAFYDGYFHFYDSSNHYAGSSSSNVILSGLYKYSLALPSYQSNYVSFVPGLAWRDFSPNSNDILNFNIRSVSLQMSISSLYRLQQETGKTNVILTEVQKQLADQGKTLDDVLGAQQDTNDKLDGIINDKVEPSLPSDSDIVGDLDDAEGQIRDDAQSGLDQGASVQQSAIQVLGQYLSAFACVSWIFDRFSTIPFVSGLLALSFSLGITGAILGIGLSIARSYSGSSRSSRSSRSKGG